MSANGSAVTRSASTGIVLVGINHQTAPLAVRERLAIPTDRLPEATRSLLHAPGVREGLILSTCNRVELLTVQDPAVDLRRFLHEFFTLPPATLDPHLYEYRESEAVRHLFRVAASLDSMVVGEPQILGQVKESYSVARSVGAASTSLDRLLQSAFTVAKKVRSETEIGASTISVASVAVDLAKKIFGSLAGKQIMLVGAGKMSDLAARHFIAQGANSIFVANRTPERAQAMAAELHGLAVPFGDLLVHAPKADVIVTSTGSPKHIFTAADARLIAQRRRGRPVFFVDIAVPRDVDPEANREDGVFVYSMDDLQQVAARNLTERSREAGEAERIVAQEVERFEQRLQGLDAVPGIVAMQQHAERIRQAELDRARSRLGTLTPEQQAAVDAMTRSMMNKFLHAPMSGLRASAHEGDAGALAVIRRLFAPRT